MRKENGRRIESLVFLVSTLVSVSALRNLNVGSLLSVPSAIFTGTITAGIWLEVSYRFLIKEATAPLDRLIEKL
jgi:hypothetical protein